jgi:hypothetical protein
MALLAIVATLAALPLSQAQAGQSANVVIIGGTLLDLTNPCTGYSYSAANFMGATYGGCLPVTGLAGELGDFAFTAMAPSAVSATSLSPFDTAVLNMASSAMNCDTGTLTASQQADLVAFVGGGKKLIIFDSECYPGPVDYSWLPFPFATANPGALGGSGTLTIVEENTLSSNNPASPYFIDAPYLGSQTDAVGDMNVMTTFDPNWCIDMSGTNAVQFTGPVHTYATYPAGTDKGLIIYNGLDQDYQQYTGDANLRKIWVQELKQAFNPSSLPCVVTIVGIALGPTTASNEVNQTHTVTATLTDLLGTPQPGVLVTFTVVSGPNAGSTGTCGPADCTSDANGQVTFTYTGDGGPGTDAIKACFLNQESGQEVCSREVAKEWTTPSGPTLTAVGPATLWVGLKNSDDQGTYFDLMVELLHNGTPVASGLKRCITGVTRNPSLAASATVAFAPFTPVSLSAGDVLALRISTRIGTKPDDTKCTVPRRGAHNSALGLRLYYDSTSRASQLGATLSPDPSTVLYLHSDGRACPGGNGDSPGVTTRFLDDAAPTAAKAKCKDSGVVNFASGNAFAEIGTWSLAPLP